MAKRVWMGALCAGLLGLATAADAAGSGAWVLGEAELDAVAAGTAATSATGWGRAKGSVFARAGVEGKSASENTGKGSSSYSTTVAEGFGTGIGGEGVTSGSTSGTGNAGQYQVVIPVTAITYYGGGSMTLAHSQAYGF